MPQPTAVADGRSAGDVGGRDYGAARLGVHLLRLGRRGSALPAVAEGGLRIADLGDHVAQLPWFNTEGVVRTDHRPVESEVLLNDVGPQRDGGHRQVNPGAVV